MSGGRAWPVLDPADAWVADRDRRDGDQRKGGASTRHFDSTFISGLLAGGGGGSAKVGAAAERAVTRR